MTGMLRQAGRFLVVGALCTLLQYLLLVAGVEGAGLSALTASSAGFVVSAMLNYQLNRRFTYASGAAHRRAVPRFLLVMLAGLLLNALFMQLLHGYLRWHYLVAQVLATAVTTIWNYTAHRSWTFVSGAGAEGRSD